MAHPYIPLTDEDRRQMLATVGVATTDELFAEIPAGHRDPQLDLPPALSEPELMRELSELAARNAHELPSFLGAGAYRHFIPSVVDHIIRRGEYLTAYTPYQPEISQGTLQSIFEFQSLVCELTGMDVANAGMYDGASALAEACLMACSVTGRDRILLLDTIHPHAIETVRTYATGRGLEVNVVAPQEASISDSDGCLAVQQPNFFGYMEDLAALGEAAHGANALFIVSADPVSLGLFRPPAEFGADIVVGEGQPLGVPLSFGGPYVGLFACREQFVRHMPGRVVGRTKDVDGRTGYVLTLQTREQHIRRERATSNICTSQQLVALAFTVALCTLGKQGLRRMAELCYHKSHYAAERIAALPGYELPLAGTPSTGSGQAFFQEFVVRCPVSPGDVNRRLLERGIIGGYDVSERIERGLLLCFSELHTREEIDGLVGALAAVNG
ncbi:MAG: aminomethyl-transferring glycine dehydrogenase subunit GcvPA [Dehalococcoidia bacterium]|nr:aminomethyl-transferring glycine dehydrogenase subunit GcvPA [Dehalococcoidia bacterium]MDZ4278809.1 aminomethyl-transferring glycine dehydrogenase subunit GcvPA [Dehalococcoidia bacterium]